jgi:SAM-dependent methyltransferase
MSFKDHFSGHADDYQRYRPSYPSAFFAWLAQQAPDARVVWDAGTGNGQAAVALAEHFSQVIATDPSSTQIAAATPAPRVSYRVSSAEDSQLPASSVDISFSAQALHWFDFERYWAEVGRVTRPGGLVIALTYNHPRVSPEIDSIVDAYIASILGDWPPERRHVNAAYATIGFPFDRIAVPPFRMVRCDDVETFLGYCGTWSAARRAWHRTGSDPRAPHERALRQAWGDMHREVDWPFAVLAGRVA